MTIESQRVVILMASYNGEKYIESQIKSIILQTHTNWVLYIADDQSTDRTIEIIDTYSKKDSRISYAINPVRYGYAGRNFFELLLATSLDDFQYIAFSDQDDIWYPTKIESSIIELDQSGCDGLSSDLTAFWHNGESLKIIKSHNQKKYDYMFEVGSAGCTYLFTSKLAGMAKSLLLENKNFRTSFYFHDWFIYALCRSNNLYWKISNKSLILYRQHSSNETGINNGLSSKFVRLRKLTSGFALDQVYKLSDALCYTDHLVQLIGSRHGARWSLISHFWEIRRSPKDCVLLLLLMLFRVAR